VNVTTVKAISLEVESSDTSNVNPPRRPSTSQGCAGICEDSPARRSPWRSTPLVDLLSIHEDSLTRRSPWRSSLLISSTTPTLLVDPGGRVLRYHRQCPLSSSTVEVGSSNTIDNTQTPTLLIDSRGRVFRYHRNRPTFSLEVESSDTIDNTHSPCQPGGRVFRYHRQCPTFSLEVESSDTIDNAHSPCRLWRSSLPIPLTTSTLLIDSGGGVFRYH
jgi:hypothetical protein